VCVCENVLDKATSILIDSQEASSRQEKNKRSWSDEKEKRGTPREKGQSKEKRERETTTVENIVER